MTRSTGADHEPAGSPDRRLDDLEEIIRSYNAVTQNLQQSHESLRQEVARLQAELASTDAQLQRSKRLAALGEMAAGIAHEIRNPLAAIQLYADMIGQDLDQARIDPDAPLQATRDTAAKIGRAVHGLNGIVNDVLSFAREIKPRPALVEVGQWLDRAVEAHRPAIEAADVQVERLDRDRGDGPALYVHGDAQLLHQALLNLIRNAVDAMSVARRGKDPDDEADRLVLDALREDGQVVVRVCDTGPGVPPETIDRIFNPFFTTRDTGTGLGLAIVHRIIDAHHGAISVHNQFHRPGGDDGVLGTFGGAVFELRLPERDPACDREQPVRPKPVRRAARRGEPTPMIVE